MAGRELTPSIFQSLSLPANQHALTDPSLGLVALIFLAGAITMLFFVILSGTTRTSPLDNTYFLQADTSGITGARDVSRWTYFYICGPGNQNCTKASPAMPFGHAWADNADNIPDGLGG